MASTLFKKLLERVPKETEEEVYRSMAIAVRMRKLMRKQGISQIDLAQIMNEHEDKIGRWLSGMYSFTTHDLIKIQAFFDELPVPISKKGNAQKIVLKSKILTKQRQSTQKSYNNDSDNTELVRIAEKNHDTVMSASVNSRASTLKTHHEKI